MVQAIRGGRKATHIHARKAHFDFIVRPEAAKVCSKAFPDCEHCSKEERATCNGKNDWSAFTWLIVTFHPLCMAVLDLDISMSSLHRKCRSYLLR